MEKSEPSLVPEWLRSHGSSTGGGSSSHHFASSQDGPLLALPKKTGSLKSNTNYDPPHSSFLDRSLSSNSRRTSSSNGPIKSSRSYSSFTRNHRDREKERLSIAENWDAEYSDPLKSITGRIGKDTLKPSHSTLQRKQGEGLQRRAAADLRSSMYNHLGNGSNSLSIGCSVTGIHKVSFERDFPSLGSEDRPTTPDISRVPSPGLTKGVQNLSIGNSSLISGESWTSALAEVPAGVGISSLASPPALQPTVAASASAPGSASMAEALVQASPRSQGATQPTVQTQRLEELVVRQSMRLIPMTHSVPKVSVSNSSDKLKAKTLLRSSELVVATKSLHPLPQLNNSQTGNQSLRGGNVKADALKTSHSKLVLTLKQGWENGATPVLKDVSSPSSSINSRIGNGQIIGSASAANVPLKNLNNPKASAHVLNPLSATDKKSAQAHVQSRNDFFNMMRKKSMNSTSVNPDPGADVSSDGVEKLDELNPSTKNNMEVNCSCEIATVGRRFPDDAREQDFFGNATIFPDEKEAAFLRSLGWEENAVDEGGLTEDEINAFYDELLKLKPNLVSTTNVCRGLKTKLLTDSQRHAACSGGASSELSATDSMI